jgi:hypothetical protein
VFLALSAVFAGFFAVVHLDHNCIGEKCSLCQEIQTARRMLEALGRLGVIALIAGLVPVLKVPGKSRVLFFLTAPTLVSLNIQCNS